MSVALSHTTPTSAPLAGPSAIAAAATLARELRPGASERDRAGIDAGRAGGSDTLIRRAGEVGLLGLELELGEAPFDHVQTLAEVVRELAGADPGLGYALARHYAALCAARLSATPAQWQLVRAIVARGEQIAAPAPLVTTTAHEQAPAAGGARLLRDPDHSRPRLEFETDTLRGAAGARWLLLGVGSGAATPVTFVLVELEPGRMARRPAPARAFGLRTVEHEQLTLAGVPVDRRLIFGPSSVPSRIAPLEQLLGAAIEVGLARTALDEVAAYIRTRTRAAFESEHERAADEPHLIKRIGELAVPLHAAEHLLARTARLLDRSLRTSGPRVSEVDALVATAELRVLATEVATRIASESLELAGASASDARHGLDRHWRDLQTLTIGGAGWSAASVGGLLLTKPPRTTAIRPVARVGHGLCVKFRSDIHD